MNVTYRSSCCAAILSLAAAAALADISVPITTGRIFNSSGAIQGARLGLKGQATLFSVDPNGREVVRWKRRLTPAPMALQVPDYGDVVVGIDDGNNHVLVLYGETGEAKADYRLDELLTPQEIRKGVWQTSTTRRWLRGATTGFVYGQQDGRWTATRFRIRVKWQRPYPEGIGDEPAPTGGKVIEVDLTSGKIVKSERYSGSS